MSKRLPYTPNSIIKNALRTVWMRSRERSEAMKNHGNACACCRRKQSKAKGRECTLEVHHLNHTVNWERIYQVIREELLIDPGGLAPLCPDCHVEQHEQEGKPITKRRKYGSKEDNKEDSKENLGREGGKSR